MSRRGALIGLLALLAPLGSGCATFSTLQSIDSLLRQARELYASGKYDEAIAKLQEVIRRDPAQWTAFLWMARAYIAKKSWVAAIDSARKAYELAPRDADVLKTLGEALLGGGLEAFRRREFSEAITHLVEYIRLRPGDAGAYLGLARAYLETGAYAEALRALVSGLGQGNSAALRSEYVPVLLDGGTRALSRSDARTAIGFFTEAVRLDPQNVVTLVEIGKAYWQAGETQQALATFQRVLQLSPGNDDALRFIRGSNR